MLLGVKKNFEALESFIYYRLQVYWREICKGIQYCNNKIALIKYFLQKIKMVKTLGLYRKFPMSSLCYWWVPLQKQRFLIRQLSSCKKCMYLLYSAINLVCSLLIINDCVFVVYFQLVRVLVSPDNPQQSTTTCQKIMNQSGEFKASFTCNDSQKVISSVREARLELRVNHTKMAMSKRAKFQHSVNNEKRALVSSLSAVVHFWEVTLNWPLFQVVEHSLCQSYLNLD